MAPPRWEEDSLFSEKRASAAHAEVQDETLRRRMGRPAGCAREALHGICMWKKARRRARAKMAPIACHLGQER
jgi:hypothetical protein